MSKSKTKVTITKKFKKSGSLETGRDPIYTGADIVSKAKDDFSELTTQILFAKVKANRAELSKQFGKEFDVMFAKLKNLSVIQKYREDLLKYLKGVRKAKEEIKKIPKQIVYGNSDDKWWLTYINNPPKDDDNSPKALAFKLLKIEADEQGLSFPDYLEKRQNDAKKQKEYETTHWVSPLTQGQMFTILYQNEVPPYYYMGLPLSSQNHQRLLTYKSSNKGWLEYKNKKGGVAQLLPDSILKEQERYRQIGLQIRKALNPVLKATAKVKEAVTPNLTPFNFGMTPPITTNQGGLLDVRIIKRPDTGLNSYASRIDAENGIDIALHYLSTHKDPSKMDYAVTSYDSTIALAENVNLKPQELFKIACDYIKLKKTEFKKRLVETDNTYLIELLVNHFRSEVMSRINKNLNAYTIKNFYNSPYVKNFMKQTNYKMDYKRFSKQFKIWIKIFTSVAHKKN